MNLRALLVLVAIISAAVGCGGDGQPRADERSTPAVDSGLAGAPDTPEVQVRVEADSEAVWLSHVQSWATVFGVAVAFVGLLGIWQSVRGARREQRIQWEPYIRVDVGPTEGGASDFDPPVAHFTNGADVRDLAPGLPPEQKIGFSAWVRNYQPNPLGVALSISATIVMEIEKPDGPPAAEHFTMVIPYSEVQKPVEVALFTIPPDWDATVWVVALSFYDLYDQRHEHRHGFPSTNAVHGRLACTYRDGTFYCEPEARPRGPKVEFDDVSDSGRR